MVAIDQRGHGDSTASSAAQYSPAILAADLESFVLERDLYVRPGESPAAPLLAWPRSRRRLPSHLHCSGRLPRCAATRSCAKSFTAMHPSPFLLPTCASLCRVISVALVGIGMGGAVALAFAAMYPRLVDALALVEYSPSSPPEDLVFSYGQAATFSSPAEAAAFLCAPCWGHEPRKLSSVALHIHGRLRRVGAGRGGFGGGGEAGWRLRMDPAWCFLHQEAEATSDLTKLTCPLLLLRGAKSHYVVRWGRGSVLAYDVRARIRALLAGIATGRGPLVRRENTMYSTPIIVRSQQRVRGGWQWWPRTLLPRRCGRR